MSMSMSRVHAHVYVHGVHGVHVHVHGHVLHTLERMAYAIHATHVTRRRRTWRLMTREKKGAAASR
jgi:hypothetical protein